MNRLVLYILLLAAFAFAKGEGACTVDSIAWKGEHTAFDESQIKGALGQPCDAWKALAAKLERYYEDQGFVAARVQGDVLQVGGSRERNVLEIVIQRGAAYVWATPENLDSGGTRRDVFSRLTGIEAGEAVSLTDLERSERRLSRIGYYNRTAPTRLFRDPARNRIVPAFSMRKANVSEAEGVLTYSSEGNVWEGKLNVNLFNIAGTARDLQLEGFTGENTRHLSGSYKEPWIFGTAWNVVVRGNFDEETVEADGSQVSDSSSGEAIERVVVGEAGITRDIGFDFSIGVFLGISEDDKHTSLEMSYVSLDRFVLPRSGMRLDASASWKIDRPDSLDNFLAVTAGITAYYPLYGNFIARFAGMAGGIFPTEADLRRSDLFALGGPGDFKGMQYRMLRSRAYGLSEFALLWQDGYDLSIEAFYQPGLYRRMNPGHGWAREQGYGIGFTQYRGNWSVNLYYALRNGCDFLDGIIGFGVKTLF